MPIAPHMRIGKLVKLWSNFLSPNFYKFPLGSFSLFEIITILMAPCYVFFPHRSKGNHSHDWYNRRFEHKLYFNHDSWLHPYSLKVLSKFTLKVSSLVPVSPQVKTKWLFPELVSSLIITHLGYWDKVTSSKCS